MVRRKYKVKDKVNFKFLGETLTGVITEVRESEKYNTVDKLRYFVFDGKYTYPVRNENIINKVE